MADILQYFETIINKKEILFNTIPEPKMHEWKLALNKNTAIHVCRVHI